MALEAQDLDLAKHCLEVEADLRTNFKVFARLDTWMEDKMREAKIKYYEEHQWDAHNQAIQVNRLRVLAVAVAKVAE